jgi:hypothetical protein
MADPNVRNVKTRDAIMKLLSDEEVARVSTKEAASSLAEGDEYLDLTHPEEGVRRVQATTRAPMGDVLPRSAVHEDTWKKIVAHAGRQGAE